MDKISVIVPVYNAEEYLDICIKSIRLQTYDNLEIILVDDGSTDMSALICDKFAKIDSRIQVIHQQNAGVSSARNVGLDASTGEYISFVDSDDFIDREMYTCLLAVLKKTESEIAICDYNDSNQNGEVTHIGDEISLNEVVDRHEIFRRLHCQRRSTYTNVTNRLYTREVLNGIRFKKNIIHEDEYFDTELFFKCEHIAVVTEAFYYYRYNPESITKSKPSINSLESVEAYYHRYVLMQNMHYFDILPGIVESAKYVLRKLPLIPISTAEEKKRKKQILQMFRYMVVNTSTKKDLLNHIISIFPDLFFSLRNFLHR